MHAARQPILYALDTARQRAHRHLAEMRDLPLEAVHYAVAEQADLIVGGKAAAGRGADRERADL